MYSTSMFLNFEQNRTRLKREGLMLLGRAFFHSPQSSRLVIDLLGSSGMESMYYSMTVEARTGAPLLDILSPQINKNRSGKSKLQKSQLQFIKGKNQTDFRILFFLHKEEEPQLKPSSIRLNKQHKYQLITLLYFMGCPSSKEVSPSTREHEFVTLVRKLMLECQQESSRLTPRIAQQKLELRAELNKPLGSRSKGIEYVLLEELARKIHLKMIYEHLSLQCRVILDRQRFVPLLFSQSICNKYENIQKLSLKQPIEAILFSISIIKDERPTLKNRDLQRFQRIALTKFKEISEPHTVEYELLNYYKSNSSPNQFMVRELAFELCQEQNLTMSKFQQIGHNFKY